MTERFDLCEVPHLDAATLGGILRAARRAPVEIVVTPGTHPDRRLIAAFGGSHGRRFRGLGFLDACRYLYLLDLSAHADAAMPALPPAPAGVVRTCDGDAPAPRRAALCDGCPFRAAVAGVPGLLDAARELEAEAPRD